jgi:predicted phosphoribosyltransferase
MGLVKENPTFRDRVGIFKDRADAGKKLAREMKGSVEKDSLLLAIPAGGVPVAAEIANELSLALDVIVVRKIQIPNEPEAGFGAVGPNDEVILNRELMQSLGLSRREVDAQIAATIKARARRERVFRGEVPFPDLQGRSVILVDDGLATGSTMLVAARFVKKKGARRIVVAVPTASMRAIELLRSEVDEIFCPNIRSGPCFAVADAYLDWYDLTEAEAIELLRSRWKRPPNP